MTTEAVRIADQLHRSYAGPTWHGASLSELLAGVAEAQASRRPIDGLHNIWELALHITAWLRIARDRLSAESVRIIAPEEGWPPVAGTWVEALAELDRDVPALEAALRLLPDERLNRRAPAAEPQSCCGLLHGAVQHNLYHAGQIALWKK